MSQLGKAGPSGTTQLSKALESISTLESESKELRSLLSQKAESDQLRIIHQTVRALSTASRDKVGCNA